MKTAIVYYSKHHGNTKKLLNALYEDNDITLIDAVDEQGKDLSEYDLVGFASGIYYSKFHKSVLRFVEECLPEDKNVFFVYTYGTKKDGYTRAVREVVSKKSAKVIGEFGCLGLDTFGPFKVIGGIAKGHPDAKDYEEAKKFFNKMTEEM